MMNTNRRPSGVSAGLVRQKCSDRLTYLLTTYWVVFRPVRVLVLVTWRIEFYAVIVYFVLVIFMLLNIEEEEC